MLATRGPDFRIATTVSTDGKGTLFLVGGSLLSIARRQRVRVNLWIAAGALVVALSTGLSRAGTYSLVYAGELIGISLMFSGFSFAGKPAPARRPVPKAPAIGTATRPTHG